MGRIRLFVSSLFLVFAVAATYAQEILTATLQHGDELKVFNGSYAFLQAHSAAVDGDIIYLSPGTFYGTDITKAVTVQGSGAIVNKEAGTGITFLEGNYRVYGNGYTGGSSEPTYIKMPDTTHNGLVLEGLYFKNGLQFKNAIKDAVVRKCVVNETFDFTTANNLHIDRCNMALFSIANSSTNVVVDNSILGWVCMYSDSNNSANSTTSTLSFRNCVLRNVHQNITAFYLNNIIGGVYYYSNGWQYDKSLKFTCSAYNNLFLSSKGNADDVIQQDGNMFIDHADIYEDANNCVLTEEAASTYLGQDGTQVGLYGGVTPYSLVPTYPQIVENNIAAQSTADGILKVSVKVAAQSK